MRRLLLVPLVGLAWLVAAPRSGAVAQSPADADSKYYRAYHLEVAEGKAEAALSLALTLRSIRRPGGGITTGF